jgi:hypothetical protein
MRPEWLSKPAKVVLVVCSLAVLSSPLSLIEPPAYFVGELMAVTLFTGLTEGITRGTFGAYRRARSVVGDEEAT